MFWPYIRIGQISADFDSFREKLEEGLKRAGLSRRKPGRSHQLENVDVGIKRDVCFVGADVLGSKLHIWIKKNIACNGDS